MLNILNKMISWPDPAGQVRGYELPPLYSSVPHASKVDPKLYTNRVISWATFG